MCTVTLKYDHNNALARRKLASLLASGLFLQTDIQYDEPTPEEVTKIEEAISKINPLAISADGKRAIEDLNLNCTKFGFKFSKLIEYD